MGREKTRGSQTPLRNINGNRFLKRPPIEPINNGKTVGIVFAVKLI